MSKQLCFYCKGELPGSAIKCRSCGEWVDGRWRLGGAGKLCLALIVGELSAMALIAEQWIPSVRIMFADFGGPVPAFTQIVLNRWWMPIWMLVLVGMTFASVAMIKRVRPRLTILASTLALGLTVSAATWWAVYLAISQLAGAIKK